MFFKKSLVTFLFVSLCFLLLYGCGGGESAALSGSSSSSSNSGSSSGTYVPPNTGCSTSCSAGDPIDEGNGVWRARNASCECINDAIQSAATGDTVNVPAGNAYWGSNHLAVSKAVKLIGAGSGNSETCNGSTSTCISGTGTLFKIVTPSTPQTFSFRLSEFYLSTTAASNYAHLFEVFGAGSGWRIDHNYFHHTHGVNSASKATLAVSANVPY